MNHFNFGGCEPNTGHAEFFGGVRKGSKFYLTRLKPFPDVGKEHEIHDPDSVLLPNITSGSTEYKCVFCSGSQPGVGGGMSDMPDPDGYMWFLTNWVPVDSPTDVPIAGLARVKLQECSESALIADPQNSQFTLTHSWLINDKNGTAIKWDSPEKLCHYFINSSTARRKTCTGPNHFVWFEKMQPTVDEHRITYWTPGVVNAVEVVWDNPEVIDDDHNWIVADFDLYHFPAALYWARASHGDGGTKLAEDDPTEPAISYTSPQRAAIYGFERAGVATLPGLGTNYGDNLSRAGIEHSPILSSSTASGITGTHGWLKMAMHHYVVITDNDDGDRFYSYSGVTHENCRMYSVEFTISIITHATIDDVQNHADQFPMFSTYDLTATDNYRATRKIAATWAVVSKGRGDYGGQDSIHNHGNINAGTDTGVAPVREVQHLGDGPFDPALDNYLGLSNHTDQARPSQLYYDSWEDPDDPNPPAEPQDDVIGFDKWRGGMRLWGAIYPGGIWYDIMGAGIRDLDGGEITHNQIAQFGGGITVVPAGGFVVVEHVRPSRWHALDELIHPDYETNDNTRQILFAGGRITTQGVRYPLTESDYVLAAPDDWSLGNYNYDPDTVSGWNDAYPFYLPVAGTGFRATDCVTGRLEEDVDHYDDITSVGYQYNKADSYAVRSTGSLHSDGSYSQHAPRGLYRKSDGTLHQAIYSAGGPLVTGKVK